ncbi:MAG: diaminopimelate epimerase [Bdellovibrionales bacterium]|nr:diaminopimelate epimerase [Bdellovibrionales bacterium]
MKFYKYHALGNDYLVMRAADLPAPFTPEQVQRICHRHFGIGSDGILLQQAKNSEGQQVLTIYNPDGSTAEKSGNGLRIFSRFLWDQHEVADEPFVIVTEGGLVRAQVQDHGAQVTVEMGTVSFDSEVIPVVGPKREVLRESISVDGATFEFNAATIGNPHCVIIRDRISADDAKRFGPHLEVEPRFPNRTNVQFMEIVDRNNIRIEIWERGAGYTLASGSSSSASAAVAYRLGLCDREIAVHMPGGTIGIRIEDDFSILMTGGVTRVAEGELFDEMLRWSM